MTSEAFRNLAYLTSELHAEVTREAEPDGPDGRQDRGAAAAGSGRLRKILDTLAQILGAIAPLVD